jgi:ADP-ribose diphosphatase
MDQKPKAEAIGWKRQETDYPFSGRTFRVRRDRLLIKGIHRVDYAYIESEGAVWVVPVTPEGEVVLIRQYRYSVDDWVWEVPAGGLFDHEGDLESLVRRELLEEVGGEADSLEYIGWFYGGAAMTNTRCHVFIAYNTRLKHQPKPEIMENIEVHVVPVDSALRMCRSGEMQEGRSALALLWSEPYLRKLSVPSRTSPVFEKDKTSGGSSS